MSGLIQDTSSHFSRRGVLAICAATLVLTASTASIAPPILVQGERLFLRDTPRWGASL